MSRYNVGLKTLLQEGLSETKFYGETDFTIQKKIVTRYKKIGYKHWYSDAKHMHCF